jgi:Tfp pilus assembly protein PilV
MSASPRCRPAARHGDTLLEVLVAVVVFAIGLLSLMAGSLVAARAMKDSKSLAAATIAAQTTMDSLKAVGWDGIAGASGSYDAKGHAVSWSVSGDNPRKVLVIITRQTSPSLVQDSLITYVGRVDVIR